MARFPNGCQVKLSQWGSQGRGLDEQPPRFQKPQSKGMVYRLKKTSFRLKQASRAWNDKIDMYFQKTSLSRSVADPQLYIHNSNGLVSLIVIYVDDLIIISSHSQFIASTKQKLHEFEMTNLGLLHFFWDWKYGRKIEGFLSLDTSMSSIACGILDRGCMANIYSYGS